MQLPPKKEYVLYTPLSERQRELYEVAVKGDKALREHLITQIRGEAEAITGGGGGQVVEEPSSDEEEKPKRSRFLKTGSDDDSSDEDEGKRVVKSAKEKRLEEMEAAGKMMDNALKINDWVAISNGVWCCCANLSSSYVPLRVRQARTDGTETAKCLRARPSILLAHLG